MRFEKDCVYKVAGDVDVLAGWVWACNAMRCQVRKRKEVFKAADFESVAKESEQLVKRAKVVRGAGNSVDVLSAAVY